MDNIEITLRIWRQNSYQDVGKLVDYKLNNLNPHMSFLEMLDVLNEELISNNEDPVAFEHDCREGICGSCSMMINGEPHGPLKGTTACQLHMFHFTNGDVVTVEPWRANAFPIVKDFKDLPFHNLPRSTKTVPLVDFV